VICHAIQRVEVLAKPLFGFKREPRISRQEPEALIVECTGQPIHRPLDDATQKAHYSGKKKRHTLKNGKRWRSPTWFPLPEPGILPTRCR
jgi:hypothetical protein